MRRRASIAGLMMALTLAMAAAAPPASFCRLVSSTHSFRQYFRDLGKSNVSPLERVVFSLVLANSKAPKAETGSEIPAGRT